MGALFTIYNEASADAVGDADDAPAPPANAPADQPTPTWAEAQQAAEEGQRHFDQRPCLSATSAG